MDFRENFRDSMARNPTSKFTTHWEAATTGVFGKDPPCNATTNHLIFEDKVKRNFYYYCSKMDSSEYSFVRHYFKGELLNERFIYHHDKLIFYMLPSYSASNWRWDVEPGSSFETETNVRTNGSI